MIGEVLAFKFSLIQKLKGNIFIHCVLCDRKYLGVFFNLLEQE